MTLEEIYYIGQTIAVVAILGSLGAIYWQQRQANRIAMTQNMVLFDRYGDSLRAIMENEDLASIFRKAMFDNEALAPVEHTRLMVYFSMMLSSHRDLWIAQQQGLASSFSMQEMDANVSWHLAHSLFLAEWKRLYANGQFAGEFGLHINELIELHEANASEPKGDAALEAP